MTQQTTSLLPALLDPKTTISLPVSAHELSLLKQARKLFDGEFYDHSLLDIWNPAVTNLRRRVEAYGSDLWGSVVKDEPGRKKYDKNGATHSERWSGVDDLVLIAGATRLGLVNNERVQEELAQTKPKDQAVMLLSTLKGKLTISAHKDEIDEAIQHVHGL